MKYRISLTICLTICLLVAIVTGLPVYGISKSSKTRRPGRVPGAAPESRWRVSEPLSFGNLTIFPVLSNNRVKKHEYITLDEGLRSRKVVISEIGASGRTHRIRPGQAVSDDAEVNQLVLTNRSGKPLVLIAGEIVVGGKQDRIVAHDCVVASTAKPVRLDVFCVERGRWHDDSVFGQSRVDPVRGTVASANRRRGRSRQGGGGAVVSASQVASLPLMTIKPGLFAPAETIMAAPNIREKAQAEKDQHAVWQEVNITVSANSVSSSTGNLNSVHRDTRVQNNLQSYEKAIRDKLPTNTIGVVAAIGGAIISADVFANPGLFRAYWTKLLRSYALQASSGVAETKQAVDRSAVETFLQRNGGRVSDQRKDLYRLREHKSESASSFQLESIEPGRSALIHFNKVRKE